MSEFMQCIYCFHNVDLDEQADPVCEICQQFLDFAENEMHYQNFIFMKKIDQLWAYLNPVFYSKYQDENMLWSGIYCELDGEYDILLQADKFYLIPDGLKEVIQFRIPVYITIYSEEEKANIREILQ